MGRDDDRAQMSCTCQLHPPQVPPAPVNKDDFVLVQRPGPGSSQEAARRYGELTKLLRQQHEVRPHQ